MSVTRAEICAVACSDAWRDTGEKLAHGVGTIPAIGVRLARLTHNPDLVVGDGEAFLMSDVPPLGGSAAAGGQVEGWLPYRRVFDVVNSGRRQSMMGGSQIDQWGNQNISAIGDWRQPKRQLIGVRGAPGNTVNHRVDYWVSRHDSRVFVEAVDIVSGVGNDRARAHTSTALRFHELGLVITNLAVLDYGDDGRLKVRSFHPGVTPEQVQAATGFDIDVSTTEVTREPTAEELELIRMVIDPHSLRDREVQD
ncbi:CoA-transferase subunit beta [Nocardioides sp.]|uniref:CoA-transferase subunit beta n=1 Tax=Nocardioides sp. TaxID=35761 RepID=UPI0025DA974A|nr:CoA-transferase [Nocardioides sp.]